LRSPSTAPFFARQNELAALVSAYESVATEKGLRVVELSGDVGVGKSHLLRQLGSALAARSDRPEVLQATRGSALLPLGFLGRLLRARFHVRADEEPDVVRARVVDGVAAAWTKSTGARAENDDGREAGKSLAELVAPLPAGPLLGTEIAGDRTRTAAAFADWVKQLASERPVVLVLEHVEWHDEPSLDLLQFLLRALRRVPVLLILSARRGPSEQIPTWLTGCDVRTKIELHPFTLEEMERFLDDLFKRIPNFPRELRSEILHRSEGNPALCRELVRLLVDRGALVVDDEHVPVRWEKGRSSKLVLPDTVLGVLQARLDGLPFAEKELLKLAAVIGRVFWIGALETLVPHMAASEVMALVDALSAREFLIPATTSSPMSGGREYSFSTQALRDTAYELVPGNSRKAAHRRVAEWLVARGELWEGGQADLAVHLDAAGEHERARRHHLSAARQALGVHAYPEAVACFERMAKSWPAETTKDDRIHRAGVLRERAAAEAKIGRFDDALRSLDSAASDLALAGVPREDAVHGWIALERGLVLKEYGRTAASLAALDEGVELAASQPPGLLHMRLYSARAFQRAAKGDRAGAAADTAAGLRIGQSLNVRDASWHLAMARLEDAEGAVYFFEEKFDAAEGAFQRSLEHRDLGGDPQGMQDAYVNLGGLAFSRRDWAAASTYYEKALASARKLRWASREAIGHSNLGQAKLAAGDAEAAVRELELACRLADEGDYLDVLADSVRALSEAQLASGAVEAALATARMGIEHAEKSGTPYFIAMANAAAMDAHLAKMNLSREKEDFTAAIRHRDAAITILREAKQTSAAEQVEKRFQKGSNSTVNT
jgi:tetratricopeptide (TPR) repeat protein